MWIISIGLMNLCPISIFLGKKIMLEFDQFSCDASALFLYEDSKALHSFIVT